MMKNVQVTPLALYKNIAGRSLFESSDQLFNEYRRRWQEQPGKFDAGDFPLFLDIEVTNSCNLRCPFCATTNMHSKENSRFISPEFVYKVLDEGRENGLYGAKFNDRGEPLLHPDLVKFVKYAKKSALIDVYFNTNAALLTEERAKEIINSGLDRISISIEGYDTDFYERCRVGAKFDLLVKNVQNFYKIRHSSGAKKPLIRIQSVLLPEIEDIFDDYVAKYKDRWGPYSDEITFIEYKEEKSPEASMQKPIDYPWACHQLWQRMVVRCDGDILCCNEDNLGLTAVGNIASITIKEAWNSVKVNEFRKIHKEGNAHTINVCNACFLRRSQVTKLNQANT